MNKKVCKCGNDEFEASQICKVDVIVDSQNFFLRNARKSMEDSCYDSDHPTGDYTCTKCGTMYENLSNLPKTKYYEILEIEGENNSELQLLLDLDDEKFQEYIKENKIKEDTTVFLKTVTFDNEFQADIKVCTGQNNAYVDCVLFDKEGNEITCCSGETLLGEVWFEYEDSIFFVDVKLK